MHFLRILNQPADALRYFFLLQTRINTKNIASRKLLHTHIIHKDILRNSGLRNMLLILYAKSGSLLETRKLFDEIPIRDVFSWTAVVSLYVRQGFQQHALTLFYQMQKTGVQPDQFIFATVVSVCSKLTAVEEGLAIHGHVIRSGFQSDIFVASALVDMYAKCGEIDYARKMFDEMPQKDVVSWNSMIAGYVQNGNLDEALQFFQATPQRDVASWNTMISAYAKHGFFEASLGVYYEMQGKGAGCQSNAFTFASVLPACAELVCLEQGINIHEHIISSGLQFDVFVANALVDMYAKCGVMGKAHNVFDRMPQRDVVSWNALIGGYALNGHVDQAAALFQKMPERNAASWSTMIAGYARNDLFEEALVLFNEMQSIGILASEFTLASVISACAKLEALKQGMEIHGKIIRCGYQSYIFVGNAVIDLYAKCGYVHKARILFDKMYHRDVVSWNTMIVGYTQNGQTEEALKLFREMKLVGMEPDVNTLSNVLSACSSLEALEHGMEIHEEIIRMGFHRDVSLSSALVGMYAKCGSIEKAFDVFDRMLHRNAISWTAMIAGCTQNGHDMEAIELFREMKWVGVEPDSKAFVSVLPACANVGSLQLGREIHGKIVRNGLNMDVFVECALLDMYAKCGSIEKAYNLFENMQLRNIVSWTAMIAGYAMHGYGKEAIQLFEQMRHSSLKPNDVTLICLLSACCRSGLVDEGWQYFNSMSENYQIIPSIDHYGCLVDLLARAGHLYEAQMVINKIPITPDATMWASLLGACRIYDNVQLGEHAAEQLFKLDTKGAAPYVLLSNMYAGTSRWDGIERVRNMMKDKRIKKTPGCSWIEVNKQVHTFLSEDRQPL
ncbi:pentatricopeptide repeat-containing protein At2g13600-like [Cryptomeria japonica]|uniref:pentatricopeptide repeat-containing protein At2g13600-like n=1 Tax=Cryptomeria japonica TaxID=3369 RepID=UPI0027D9FDC1|nr:pentatricopeptide repeat-containing protein At2g13600-like [Cryptomeria japonica]